MGHYNTLHTHAHTSPIVLFDVCWVRVHAGIELVIVETGGERAIESYPKFASGLVDVEVKRCKRN
jgi:hypothetical protein